MDEEAESIVFTVANWKGEHFAWLTPLATVLRQIRQQGIHSVKLRSVNQMSATALNGDQLRARELFQME